MKSQGWKTEVKLSKSESKIPVVDGVHLHSVYNPIKEAESFASQNKELLTKKNTVLIFGLGFGYHVKEAEVQMRKKFGDQYLLWVIEPNLDVYQGALKEGLIKPSKNLRITCCSSVESFFQDVPLMNYLSMSPSVIPHPASFNLYNNFFKSFMTYKASKLSSEYSKFVKDEELRNYLIADHENSSLETIWEEVKHKNKITKHDLLLQGLEAVITQRKEEVINE
ncbi:hypothetical protein OAT67_00460 [Bacteriovoracaceae bacterium]|nr:hypothetical protein [Bacteriovoracaceae bacterium]|tara:strand:- start:203771 stop:204439 length:669 start_codon:yes stop_codon:yes gene_type:complete